MGIDGICKVIYKKVVGYMTAQPVHVMDGSKNAIDGFFGTMTSQIPYYNWPHWHLVFICVGVAVTVYIVYWIFVNFIY